MRPTCLWTIRHGEVEASHVGRFIGTTDAPLSDVGRHQAQAIGEYLRDAQVDAVLSSPRSRAVDTIAPMAAIHDLKVQRRPALAEMDFGDWEGLDWTEIEARDREFAVAWQADPGPTAIPGGESPDGFALRVQDELARITEEFAGRNVVIGGHAGTNRAIIAKILDRPYMDTFRFAQDYGCVNAHAWTPEGFGQIVLLNFVPGPRSTEQGE